MDEPCSDLWYIKKWKMFGSGDFSHTTLALEVSTAPWGDLSDDVIFYSEDESIAEVRRGRKTKQYRQDKTAEEKQFHVL